MPTLLCRRCNQTMQASALADGSRPRCPACAIPMVVETEAKGARVVRLRARRSQTLDPESSRRSFWILIAASGFVLALAGGVAVIAIDVGLPRFSSGATDTKRVIANTQPGAETQLKFAVGSEAVLVAQDPTWLWLVTEDESRDAVAMARRKRDVGALAALADRGKLFRESPGSRVMVLSASGSGYWVRVRQGNHPRNIGWIPQEYLAVPTAPSVAIPKPGSPYQIGEVVELIGTTGREVLLSTEEKFVPERASALKNGLGTRVFPVAIAAKARIREIKGDDLRVRLDDLFRNGREGWIVKSEVRRLPTALEMEQDVVGGLDQGVRRQIFMAIRAMERDLGSLIATGILDEAATRERGRSEIASRFQIDRETLNRIEIEGEKRRWPAAAQR